MGRENRIHRAPESAQKTRYDLVIIGGGIYGAMLALESARRGLKPLLLERGDFGGETSFNSLRIVHGGLRYLQKLDLRRFRESVSERKWFLKTFPDLVKPLPCLMPLYGTGLHRKSILRLALKLNDGLSADRNQGVPESNHLPPGSVVGLNETRHIFPAVSSSGLEGAAKWYDAVMVNSQRVIVEVLRWACKLGACAINYVEADQLLTQGPVVTGVSAFDRLGSSTYRYEAPVVVNAAGPWCRELAARYHTDIPTLFRPSIAMNLLLDRPALSDHALALNPRKHEGHTYFLVPWHGKIFAGTGHYPIKGEGVASVRPSFEQISMFLSDLNSAVPKLKLKFSDILYIHDGLLPVSKSSGTQLTVREVIVNHGQTAGPKGLYSVSGIKFTTSRLVAEKTLQMIFQERAKYTNAGKEPPMVRAFDTQFDPLDGSRSSIRCTDELKLVLQQIIEEEAVQHLDDLLYRRTSLYENPQALMQIAKDVCQFIKPSTTLKQDEIGRLRRILRSNFTTSP